MKSKLFLFFLVIPFALAIGQVNHYVADKSESFIKYKLTHPLHEITAVSKDAFCAIDADIKAKLIKEVSVQVPVSSFDSGNSNRDSHAMEVVEELYYPDARFISSSVTQNGDSLQIWGNLTFHGVTKKTYIAAFADWNNNKLTVDGKFDISLTAFKIKRPSLLLIPVNDTLKFWFTQVFNI